MPKWRNWQTHQIQGLAPARVSGFKSRLRHQFPPRSLNSTSWSPPVDRSLLLYTTLLLEATRLALACLQFRFVSRLLHPSPIQNACFTCSPSRVVVDVGRAVQGACQRVMKAKPSLAHRLLAKSGHNSDPRISVARDDNSTFAAHAWVENHRKIVLGRRKASRYTPLGSASGTST